MYNGQTGLSMPHISIYLTKIIHKVTLNKTHFAEVVKGMPYT